MLVTDSVFLPVDNNSSAGRVLFNLSRAPSAAQLASWRRARARVRGAKKIGQTSGLADPGGSRDSGSSNASDHSQASLRQS
jgi:hypothetical protein